VTQPAVSRMLGRFEQYLGVRLFDRSAGGAILTEEGELLYRRVLDGISQHRKRPDRDERRRRGTEPSTALTLLGLHHALADATHGQAAAPDFPMFDLRFQLISGSLRGPVENVDFGMRFRDQDDLANGALVMKKSMLRSVSPGYRMWIPQGGETSGARSGSMTSFITKAPLESGSS